MEYTYSNTYEIVIEYILVNFACIRIYTTVGTDHANCQVILVSLCHCDTYVMCVCVILCVCKCVCVCLYMHVCLHVCALIFVHNYVRVCLRSLYVCLSICAHLSYVGIYIARYLIKKLTCNSYLYTRIVSYFMHTILWSQSEKR